MDKEKMKKFASDMVDALDNSASTKDGGRSAIKRYEEETTNQIEQSQLSEPNKEFPEIEEFAEDLEPSEFVSGSQFEGEDPENSEELEPVRHNRKHEVVTTKDNALRDVYHGKTDDTGSGTTK